MSAPLVLVLDSLVDDLTVERQAAASRGWSLLPWDGSDSQARLADAVVHVCTRVDGSMITKLTSCRAIGRFGTGLDTVDLPAAAAAGIPVVNVRDYCVPELATHTVGLALTLQLRIGPGYDNQAGQAGDWSDYMAASPRDGDPAALIVGCGAVGQRVAAATASLGLRTMVSSRRDDAVVPEGTEKVELAAGLEQADLVFLQRELSDKTRAFFDAEMLSLIRPTTVVVNTARKDLMDQAAVVAALSGRRLGGLGLDARIASTEPLAQVLTNPRVLVTPHVGWYSERSLTELRELTIVNTLAACQPSAPVQQ
jgi:D-3-phosphoglycerate dehydrogenase